MPNITTKQRRQNAGDAGNPADSRQAGNAARARRCLEYMGETLGFMAGNIEDIENALAATPQVAADALALVRETGSTLMSARRLIEATKHVLDSHEPGNESST